MGLAGAAAGACDGADAVPCASTTTGTTERAANRKESLVTRNAPLRMRLHRPEESRKTPLVTNLIRSYVIADPKVRENIALKRTPVAIKKCQLLGFDERRKPRCPGLHGLRSELKGWTGNRIR